MAFGVWSLGVGVVLTWWLWIGVGWLVNGDCSSWWGLLD